MNDTGNNLCLHQPNNNNNILPFVPNGDKEDSTPAIDYFLLLYAPLTTLNACRKHQHFLFFYFSHCFRGNLYRDVLDNLQEARHKATEEVRKLKEKLDIPMSGESNKPNRIV